MTGLLAVIELGFDPLLQIGPLAVRWQTLGVTVALLLAVALAALLIPRLPKPKAAQSKQAQPKAAAALTPHFPDAPEIIPATKPPQASSASPDPASRQPTLEQLLLILVGIVPGAVVGGRIVHVLDFMGAYAADPMSVIDPRVGSLSLLGAVLGGTLSALYVCHLLRAPVDGWAAIATVPLLLVLGLGKLAQLVGGAGQGIPFDGPWSVAFVGDGPWVSFAPQIPSHPSQVYEGIWLLVGIAVFFIVGGRRREPRIVHPWVAWADRSGSGELLFIGAICWFLVGRFLVGFTWRDPSEVGPLNMEQFLALVLLAVGGSFVWLRRGQLVRTVALLLTLVLVSGCGSTTSPVIPSITPVPTPTATPAPTPAPTPSPTPSVQVDIDAMLRSMTVDSKIGQLFMVSFYGDAAAETTPAQVKENQTLIGADNIADAIARYHLGGVIYFTDTGNLVNAAQIATLSNSIQAAAGRIPLLISTDQEGGEIIRLPSPATEFSGNMALGATGNPDLARSVGQAMGQELAALGINDVLAPVGDVNVNPANPIIGLRSFGADAPAVAAMTAAMVRGFQDDAGIGATVKHFPGHGDTNIDSHSQLPLIGHSMAQWQAVDEPPFAAAIEAGARSVMVGHLAFPALDASGMPSSLSAPIVTDVLRGELGFNGVVITDGLDMGALRDTYGDDRIPVLAIAAGDDVLLLPPSLPVAYAAVQAAVASGEISEARLDQSVRRILLLKQSLGLFDEAPLDVEAAESQLGTAAHRSLETQVAKASVTVVANDGGVLPLPAPSGTGQFLVVGPSSESVDRLALMVRARGATVTTKVTGFAPPPSVATAAATAAQSASTVIALTWNADADVGQQRVVRALAATGKPVITVAIGRPYDQGYYRAAINICVYSDSDASLRALVRVLFGDISPAGHLPVAIPDAAHPETTLYPLGYGLTY